MNKIGVGFIYLTIVYMVYLFLKIYATINNKKTKFEINKHFIVTLIIGAIPFTINNILNYTQYKTIVSLIILFLIYLYYFRDKIKETLVSSIIILGLVGILELCFSLLLLINSSLNTNNISIFVKIIMSIIVYNFAYFLVRKYKFKLFIKKINSFAQEIFLFETTLLLIIFIINISLFFRSENFNNIYNIISIIILIFYIIFTLIQIVKGKYVIQKLEAKNKELTNSYKASSTALEQFRELKHNLKNDLYSIKGILPKEKQVLLNNILTKYNSNYDWLNNITDIPEGLQGIIYLKKLEAEKHKVKLIVNYNSKKEIKDKDFLDICDILGIYLDNAIEASKEKGDKTIVLDIRDYYDSMILKVINKFSNSVNLTEIGNKDYSTKNRNSGLGLNYISKIKNKNIKTTMQIVNNLFITSIEYKVKEK